MQGTNFGKSQKEKREREARRAEQSSKQARELHLQFSCHTSFETGKKEEKKEKIEFGTIKQRFLSWIEDFRLLQYCTRLNSVQSFDFDGGAKKGG